MLFTACGDKAVNLRDSTTQKVIHEHKKDVGQKQDDHSGYDFEMKMSIYRDAGVYFDEASIRTERQMKINGQTFFVTSVVPSMATATPSEKIIKLIDLDVMKKDNSFHGL